MAKVKVPQTWRENAYKSYIKQQNINKYRYGFDKSGSVIVTGESDTRNVSRSTGVNLFLRVFAFFLILIICINVYRHVNSGSSTLTFTSFLNWLSHDFKSIEINVDISSFGVGGNWGPFDGFRIFLDRCGTLFGGLAWLGANMINVVVFIAQFVSFLLG